MSQIEVTKEIRKHVKWKEIKTKYQNLQNAAKIVLTTKFIKLNVYIKKQNLKSIT